MNFQARLLQSSGALVADGNYNVEFKLYNVSTSGSPLWTETYQQTNRVRVANGYLTVNLGSLQAFPNINWDQELWLTMNIGGTDDTTPVWDGEMTPRLKLTAVPHAFTASKLQQTNGANTSTLGFDTQSQSNNILLPDESGTVCLQGSANCGFVSGSAGDFIQNSTSPQTGNFNISGSGTIGGTLSVATIDRATAGTLNIGTTTATAVTIGRISGTVNVAGGNINLQGNTAISAGNTLTVSSGELAITGRSSGSNTALRVNNHTSTGNIFVAQDAATDVFVIADGGSVLSKTNSSTGFQIQNTSATSNLFIADTTNTRIGIGATPANSLLTIGTNTTNAAGGVTFGTDTNLYRSAADTLKTDDTFDAAAFSVGGTAGLAVTCSAGQMLQDQVVVGGIVTSGTCVSGGASSLQGAYNGGNTVLTNDGEDISFTLADTTTDSNFIINVEDGSTGKFAIQSDSNDTFSVDANGNVLSKTVTNSTNAFQVQNANGDSLLNIDSANNVITLGGNNSGELQQWQTTTALPNPRWFSTSAVANGYVYVIGGAQASGDPRDTVYYAKINSDGTVGSWVESTNDLPTNLQAHSTVATNGYIYVIGGNNGSGATTNVYGAKLNSDGSTSPWYPQPSIGAGSYWHKTVAANGYIYGMGGYSGSGNYDDVVRAKVNSDGTLGTWTSLDDLPTGLQSFGTVVANGYIYVIGGYNGSTFSDEIHYAKINGDGSLGTWNTDTDVLPLGLDSLQSVVMNGYVYVIGGHDGTSVQSNVYYAKLEKNGGTGPWQTAVNGLPEVRSQATAVTNNGYMYLIGGRGPALTPTPVNTVYYTSGQRLMVGGSLDLVGLSDSDLADEGSLGGSLTAGNTNIVGTLQVRGDTSFAQSVTVGGNLNVNGSVTFNNDTDSANAFRIQNAAGYDILNVSTAHNGSNGAVQIAEGAYLDLSSGNSEAWLMYEANYLELGVDGNYGVWADQFSFGSFDGSETFFTINEYGDTVFRSGIGDDYEHAFQIQNSGGGVLFNADTENMRIGIGTDTPEVELHIMGQGAGGSGAKLAFGDYDADSQQNVFIGERGSGDSDQMQIQGRNGIVFTTGENAQHINLEIDSVGAAYFQNTVDSTIGFGIYSTDDTEFFRVDTLNGDVHIGTRLLNVDTDKDYVISNGTASVANEIPNSSFESDITSVSGRSGYESDSGNIDTSGNNARTGYHAMRVPAAGAFVGAGVTKVFDVSPGEQLYFRGWVKTSSGTNGQGGFYLACYDRDWDNPTWHNSDWTNPGTTWALRSITLTVPAGCAKMVISMTVRDNSTTGNWYFDDLYLTRSGFESPALFKNAEDSDEAFQVQNSAGDTLLNGDTENMRVGIGTNTPREALHVMGPDTANNGGKGRIVIGDYCHEDDVTCTESGSNVFIGEYYVRGSTNFEDIDTDKLQMQGKLGLLFTTGIEADKINLEITGNGSARFQNTTDSTTAFRIQRSVSAGGGNVLTADTTNNRVLIGSATSPTLSSAQLVVTVAEVQSTLRVGNATNGISFNDTATGESGKLRLYGTARNTKKITLSPEYAGAVLSGTGIGSMTSGVDWSAGKNYYRWTSTQSTLQWYEIVIAVPLPSDWSEWAPGTAAMSIETWRPDGGGQGEIRVYDTNGDEDFYVDDIDDVYNTWVPYNFDLSNTGYVADGKMYIRVALGAENSSSFQIGDITLTYLSKY